MPVLLQVQEAHPTKLDMSKPTLFSRFTERFNRGLTIAVLVVAVSSFDWGFDNQGSSRAQAMHPFIRQFGVQKPTGSTISRDIGSRCTAALSSLVKLLVGHASLF